MVTTRPPKTIVKPTALGPVANTDTKLLIYGLFQKGRVLAQDGEPVVRVEACRLGAEQEYAASQYSLGVMYYNGEGVPQDYAEAFKWCRLAAEQRYASAQRALGVMYDTGKGVPQNDIQAHMWFNLAGARGNENDVKEQRLEQLNLVWSARKAQ